MARAQVPFFSLNSGEIDKNTTNRIDLEKMRMAAETMVNWMPQVRGPMSMRPGTKYLSATKDYGKARLIPFIFNASTTSLIEAGSVIRVRNNDTLVSYPAYSSTIANADFDDAIGTGWTNASTTGASATTSGGKLVLASSSYTYARARQAVSVSSGDLGVLHCVKIVVVSGPVSFRVGRTAGGEEILSAQSLETGTHFIAFRPDATTIYLEFEANETNRAQRSVELCVFVKNQVLELPSPWAEADLNYIRSAQSGSIIFVACKGYKPYRIERRGPNSWGIAEYKTSAGPYMAYSGTRIRLKASDTVGNITLTADQPLFKPEMVGAVFELAYQRQMRKEVLIADGQATQPIKVTGVGPQDRTFSISLTYGGGASGTVKLERSFGTDNNWKPFDIASNTETFTATGVYSFCDTDSNLSSPTIRPQVDNQIIYYRLRASGAIAGTIAATLNYQGGTSQIGVVRITGYVNSTTVTAEVISELGAVDEYTDDWREGAWSANRSWPTSVAFHDGRLWWSGLDKIFGSVSDDFYNFDPNVEGDAAPINRSVALGPVEGIHWMLSNQRLLVGTASAEVSIRSNSIDEPITPAKFTARNASTLGSANTQAVSIDSTGIFVQRNGSKVFQLAYDVQINDYSASELTRINQQICSPGVVSMAAQRQPDTRVYFAKEDGTIAVLLFDREEGVAGWSRIETDGAFESICTLPTGTDDDVYVVVRRRIDGVDRRYIEKFVRSSDLGGGVASSLMDSFITWTAGTATTTVTGIDHLAGKEVVVFALVGGFEDDGFEDLSFQTGGSALITYATVGDDGSIELDTPITAAIIGLPYEAQFKSVKLAYGSQAGTALTQKKRVNHLAIVGVEIALDGLRIGRDFNNMTKISNIYKGREVGEFEVFDEWDYEATAFGGKYDTDSRVCIKNISPYPATISGLVVSMETNDRG